MAHDPMQHRCVIRSGSLAGNKRSIDVSEFDIEFKNTCDNCGEELAPIRIVVAWIYAQLTRENSNDETSASG